VVVTRKYEVSKMDCLLDRFASLMAISGPVWEGWGKRVAIDDGRVRQIEALRSSTGDGGPTRCRWHQGAIRRVAGALGRRRVRLPRRCRTRTVVC